MVAGVCAGKQLSKRTIGEGGHRAHWGDGLYLLFACAREYGDGDAFGVVIMCHNHFSIINNQNLYKCLAKYHRIKNIDF